MHKFDLGAAPESQETKTGALKLQIVFKIVMADSTFQTSYTLSEAKQTVSCLDGVCPLPQDQIFRIKFFNIFMGESRVLFCFSREHNAFMA